MTRTHGIKLNPLFTPDYSAQVAERSSLLPYFSQFATTPPLPKLRLICDFLFPEWEIVAHNPTGVTVEDVVEAIYETLHKRLEMHEWERLSFKQRNRIEEVHRARCMMSSNPERTRLAGVRRADYLLNTTMFAGLTSLVRRGREWQVVLTLSRDFRHVATFARS